MNSIKRTDKIIFTLVLVLLAMCANTKFLLTLLGALTFFSGLGYTLDKRGKNAKSN